MARGKLGFTYFGGIGDCLRIVALYHGPLLHWLNRGRTPIRWNEGGSAGSGMVNDYIISRIPGFYAPAPDEQFTDILRKPRWQRFFRWTRRPIPFRLRPEEEAVLPKLAGDKPNIAICPHHHGLACKKLPAESINRILAVMRRDLDAHYWVFEERAVDGGVDAPCISGLNLTQAMVLMARFDAALSVDSWQKYIMGMHGKPQTALVVDFRKNESYTYEGTPLGVYEEFFRWRVKPEEIAGYNADFTQFRWKTAAEVDPEILARHLLERIRNSGRHGRFLK
ncbi:MAG TPA: hypothetical protein VHY22_09420 [Chthoniobacteraceae bacterium]|jgi:hypothetical protein|nr:hypothetical protein [Chthoniobacteraceae bacterium]